MHASHAFLLVATAIARHRARLEAHGSRLHQSPPPRDARGVLVVAGLTPLAALQAATLGPAKLLNQTADFGSVERNKVADLVLLEENPLDDIRRTQRIAAVVSNGKLLRRADLDALLREAEDLAARN